MIAGRYELEREIGRGGMGAVWLAHDTVLGRRVAIKRIGMMPGRTTPELDLDRAEREARLAARLNHPHVVHVFDLVAEDDGQWLVMEYIEGQTLSEMIHREGALAPEAASSLVGQVADALAAAHDEGIVHRDVKPSNILVMESVDAKLSDFGIARAEADPSLTQTGLVTGSPAYLSPEVASGEVATAASDVWSLGATLFHALSGRPPYQVGDNLMGALFKIVHDDPPRLPEAGWLAPVLEATMTKEPRDRWTMRQVRDFLAGGPEGVAATAPLAVGEATRVMAAAPLAAPQAPPPREPEPAPVPAAPERTHDRRPMLLPVVLTLALLVLIGIIAWVGLTGDPDDTQTIDRPDATGSSQTRPSGQQSSEEPQPERPTAQGMETFIDNYLATAPRSPETTFQMLTPGFKRASGGLSGYSGYWSTIQTADLVEVSADPETLVVDYVVAYVRDDGSEVTDDVTLQLQYKDGEYLIAGES